METVSQKSGLGLVSLQERASFMGGHLLIEIAPGRGSRFELSVPLSGSDTWKTESK